MCTPFGHSLLGYSMASGYSFWSIGQRWVVYGLILFLSNLPDVDFLFGYFTGNPNRYHHGWTHSLMFAVIVGVVFGVASSSFTRHNGIRAGIVAFILVLSHILLDFFTKDTRPPFGMPLFWPASKAYFISHATPFLDVTKASTNGEFLSSLFCVHNLRTVLSELAIFVPLTAGIFIYRRRKERRHRTA
ncbi:MAG: metal-dependent hydrolase [bacterium]